MTWEFSLIGILLKPKPKIILILFRLLRVDLVGGLIDLSLEEDGEPHRVSLQLDPPSPPSIALSGSTGFGFDFRFSDQIVKIHKVQLF